MFNALIEWDGKQNVVVITDGQNTMRIPLDDFIALPTVRYVTELAVERAGLELLQEEPPLVSH